jgi:hypothetical protein
LLFPSGRKEAREREKKMKKQLSSGWTSSCAGPMVGLSKLVCTVKSYFKCWWLSFMYTLCISSKLVGKKKKSGLPNPCYHDCELFFWNHGTQDLWVPQLSTILRLFWVLFTNPDPKSVSLDWDRDHQYSESLWKVCSNACHFVVFGVFYSSPFLIHSSIGLVRLFFSYFHGCVYLTVLYVGFLLVSSIMLV